MKRRLQTTDRRRPPAWFALADDPKAFAETVRFRARSTDLQELAAIYEEHLWPAIRRLRRRTEDVEEPETREMMVLSIVWAPAGADRRW